MDTINATEAAVELAAAHDLDLSGVIGTGAGGRITKDDVEILLAERESASPEPPETHSALAEDVALAQIAACRSLAELITLPVDRTLYAKELHARALVLLKGS